MLTQKEVFDILPMWEYKCPTCQTYVELPVSFCHNCMTPFDEERWRVPPRKKIIQKSVLRYFTNLVGVDFDTLTFKDDKAMSVYAYKVLAPKLTKQQRELLFQYFTVLFSSGWENSGGTDVTDGGAWTGSSGTPTVVNTPVHHGSYAMKVDCDAVEYVYKSLGSNYSNLFCRFYWRTTGLPGAFSYANPVAFTGTSGLELDLGYYNDGVTIMWFFRVEGTYQTYAQTVTLNTWYCIEVEFDADDDTHKLWVNGVNIITLSKTTSNTVNQVNIGVYSCDGYYTADYTIDCVVVADTPIGQELPGGSYSASPLMEVLNLL